ncbi:MAG TPA: HlyD family efflux transporter periplasmic adaptor subunit [Planctomycetota bacterium]|nr:HlyD family efflux transporter periplasmic adaptor subunit [Planctomycetota bacterium]
MRKGTLLVWIIGVAVVVALLYWGFRSSPVEVEVAPVVRDHLRVTVDEDGKTRVRERFDVTAPVAGTLARIDLEVGDEVERGAALATILPPPSAVLDPRTRAELEARVVAAQASLERARESLASVRSTADLARTELERTRALFERGSITRSELDEAEALSRRSSADERAAEFAVEAARAELRAAEAALSAPLPAGDGADGSATVPVLSPVDGRIIAIHRKSGGPVVVGEPLLAIADVRDLEVIVDVLSPDAVRIEPGAKVELERWGGGDVLLGRVRTVEPVAFTDVSALGVEEQRVIVVIDLVSPRESWASLGEAYRVEARIVTWEEERVLQAPASALFRHGEEWAAFVFDREEETVSMRAVEPGHWAGLRVEILSGLEEGEEVVTHPPDDLRDGSEVTIADRE